MNKTIQFVIKWYKNDHVAVENGIWVKCKICKIKKSKRC